MPAQVSPLDRLVEGARVALRATYRERCHLPGSPWFAYLSTETQGIIVDRDDKPEEPIPAWWKPVVRVNNARSDDANLATIREALFRFPIGGAS